MVSVYLYITVVEISQAVSMLCYPTAYRYLEQRVSPTGHSHHTKHETIQHILIFGDREDTLSKPCHDVASTLPPPPCLFL